MAVYVTYSTTQDGNGNANSCFSDLFVSFPKENFENYIKMSR